MDHERIIHIYDYLSRYTDENHFVTINQIQAHLANSCNLSRVKSVTIRRDLDRLTTMGNHIVKQRIFFSYTFHKVFRNPGNL